MTKNQTAGAVASEESAESRFGRLMDAIEFGEVVPFLGARISLSDMTPIQTDGKRNHLLSRPPRGVANLLCF